MPGWLWKLCLSSELSGQHAGLCSGSAPPPAPLLWSSILPEAIVRRHKAVAPVPGIELVSVPDVWLGGLGLLCGRDGLVFPPNVYPLYVPGMLESLGAANPGMRSWLGAVQDGNASVRSIDRPAIAPLHPNRVFGHFLMEMVPKILLLDQCCPKNWPVAAAAFPSWLRPILEMLMPWREIVWYDPNKEIVKAPRFVTSTQFIHGEQIHPDFRSLLEMAKARIVMSSGEWTSETRRKIYISRSKAEVDWHKIENESEIERALQGIGFEVVHPQLMSFADQVRTFDAASIVVGEYSSAMHNAVFCRPGTVVVCLNWINDYQSRIASLFGHTIGFIKPTGNEFKDSSQWGKGMQLLHFSTHRVLKYVSRALPAAAP